jgi:hypothetical protein
MVDDDKYNVYLRKDQRTVLAAAAAGLEAASGGVHFAFSVMRYEI